MGNARISPMGKQNNYITIQNTPQAEDEHLQFNVNMESECVELKLQANDKHGQSNDGTNLDTGRRRCHHLDEVQQLRDDRHMERERSKKSHDDIDDEDTDIVYGDDVASSVKRSEPEQPRCPGDNIQTEALAIVAIDFGTTFTGYAFSLSGRKDSIMTARHGGMLQEDKVPTSVLLKPDKTFDSFGYVAQSRYGSLTAEEQQDYYYLEHFKMALYHTKRLSRKSKIKDKLNKQINALHVFSVAIRYFYDLAFKIAKDKWVHVKEYHIGWILTIPAIWTDSAKQFMREAATKAGIREDRLRLVLEPEAASLFCQEAKVLVTARQIEQLPVGHKYILADIGGGTVDICIHEILEERNLRELYRATGGDHGGNQVNKAYFEFLENLFGSGVWATFVKKTPNLRVEMMKDFERKKKTFSLTGTPFISVDMEDALLDILESNTDESLESLIDKSMYRNDISYKEETGHFRISSKVMETFFLPAVNGILDKLQEILDDCNDPELQTLMLVGGFADSPYLREKIAETFPSLKLVLHSDTILAVLKGAVMMGYMPRNIVQRRARFTYGFSYDVPYISGEHPASLKVTEDGKAWCSGVFSKMIEKDQILHYGDTFSSEGHSTAYDAKEKHKKLHTSLWRSNRRNPVYCRDEPGQENCDLVGMIVHRPPAGGWPDYWVSERQLIVGETELTVRDSVRDINKTTTTEYETKVDFL